MVHRRILHDDYRGVAEPLNETANGEGLIARGKHWLFYSDTASYHMHRDIGLDMFYKPSVVVGNQGELEVGSKYQLLEPLNYLHHETPLTCTVYLAR